MGRGNGVMFWEYKLGAPSRWRLQIGFLNPPVKFNPELDQGGEKLIFGSMQTCPALLLLLLAACALPARCSAPQPSCPHFSELLPAKLKELRITFEKMKDYFVSITLSSFSFYLFFCLQSSVIWVRGKAASSWCEWFGCVLCYGLRGVSKRNSVSSLCER